MASFAVIREPLFLLAAVTKRMSERAAIRRFLCGNVKAEGFVVGGYSLITSPLSMILSINFMCSDG